jgi:hypothetical protein
MVLLESFPFRGWDGRVRLPDEWGDLRYAVIKKDQVSSDLSVIGLPDPQKVALLIERRGYYKLNIGGGPSIFLPIEWRQFWRSSAHIEVFTDKPLSIVIKEKLFR